jgi:hypothetical protein
MLIVITKCRGTGCSVNTEGSWTVQLWWILSGSSLLPPQKLAASEGSVACALLDAMLGRYQ